MLVHGQRLEPVGWSGREGSKLVLHTHQGMRILEKVSTGFAHLPSPERVRVWSGSAAYHNGPFLLCGGAPPPHDPVQVATAIPNSSLTPSPS